MTGLPLALEEITLVAFTTLAPSGAVALALQCAFIAAGRRAGADALRSRLIKLLWVPIVVTMVGLVASATHLGNPSNALYVLTGIGRSPLSTEVGAAVALLAAAGLFWLYGFSEHPRGGLQQVWAGVIAVLAAAFVTTVALAYGARTIPSWNTPLVPAALWLQALTGGPVLAAAVMRAAQPTQPDDPKADWASTPSQTPAKARETQSAAKTQTVPAATPVIPRLEAGMLALVSAAMLAGFAVGIARGLELPEIRSSLATAAELVPHYWLMLGISTALQAAGIALAWRAWRIPERRPEPVPSPLRRARPLVTASCLILLGIFVARFTFYMTHLTSGL
ncbi:MAG: dimethyl sulfoxide reductase anchor subunit [Coriobacteriia bacterium]|nr:dimethyl sulfoxide reductase anchor subunit [Coriobacteriia bacterium]MBS5477852.1 dimethyl sulfoxide reductase anchor subunit [Coriobacteriia bacterium]